MSKDKLNYYIIYERNRKLVWKKVKSSRLFFSDIHCKKNEISFPFLNRLPFWLIWYYVLIISSTKKLKNVPNIPWSVVLCLHKYYEMSTRYRKEINKCHYIYSALIEFLEFNFIVPLCCNDSVSLKWISKLMSFIVPVCSAHSRSLTHNQDTQHAVWFWWSLNLQESTDWFQLNGSSPLFNVFQSITTACCDTSFLSTNI